MDNSTIPGWYTSRTTYTANDGGSGTGSLYSYGSASSTDRALGNVGSGTTGNILAGVRLVNNTGATITSLDISFVGEQWRTGGSSTTGALSVAQTVDFQYQVANPGVVTDANVPLTAGWVDYNPLDFTSPRFGTNAGAALDGNNAANRVPLSSTLTVNVTPGQEIWLRWLDINHADNDHGMAIDDFSVTANGAGPTNPSGVGNANPNSVLAGGTTLLTVAATGGTSPLSTGLGVTADLTAIGGVAGQTFYDDGTHGDVTLGDNTFSYSATVANGTAAGAKSLPFSVTDAQSRSGGGSIGLTVVEPTPPSGTGAANPNPVQAGNSSLLTVTVTPGTHPTSTGINVTGDLSSIGGSNGQQFYDDGTHGDAAAGNNVFSFNATVASNTPAGLKNLPVQIADAQSRTGSATIQLSVQDAPVPPGSVVISQVYGGGGNSGSVYKNDFIEIFNRSDRAIDLTGWSVQYASSSGASWQVTPLTSVVLAPGQYYLVREAPFGGGTTELPQQDAPAGTSAGTINMSASNGKVALVRTAAALSGNNPVGNPNLMDFIGYGSADFYEGAAAAPALSNTTAALRSRNGCKDTDQNGVNFVTGAPTPRNTSTPFNVCPVGPQPPEVFSTDPANGGTNFPLAGNIKVNFDDAVTVQDGGFTLTCTASGPHTLAVTGGPTSFTLNPDTDLLSGETCTATVLASHVSSQAATPVPMAADYTWTFEAFIIRDPAEHMVMGNPSGAVTDESVPLNYLMMKDQYALSYNNDKGIPNWTSWHLDSTWTTGVADRQNDFRPDNTLPASFKHVQSGYRFATYGFDRGHMVPSADRTSSEDDNSATFLMTNMIPQASGNNQGPWNFLEQHIRTLLNGSANEIYIVSGGHGVGGNSSTGYWESILDTGNNSVTVPKLTWKVVMVLPRANGDDVARVNTSTRTFAVIMPNNDNIRNEDWKKYIATVDQVEALTGYDFYSKVPDEIEAVIEAELDEEYDTAPVANGQSVTTAEDTAKAITLSVSDFNVNNEFTYTVVDGPTHGQFSGAGGTLTYTPFADYNGPDSFTFKANDGAKDSNVATVSINVTPVNDAPTLSGVPASATVNELAAYTFTASAEDVDSGTLTFSLAGAPDGASISPAGVFTWTPTEAQGGVAAPYEFTVRVSDGTSNTDAPVSITVAEVNQAPTLAPVAEQDVFLGGTVTFTAVGADADLPAQALSYSLAGAPEGATINPATGAFNWTPTAAQAGQTYTFSVFVTDNGPGPLSAGQPVTVGVGHTWSGFLQPINQNGNSVFKLGQTIPVKFQLTGAGAGVTDAVARLHVAKVTDSIVGTEEAAGSTANATEGNLFRYADGQYVFNLSTKALTTGTYQLRVDLGDGIDTRVVQISLR